MTASCFIATAPFAQLAPSTTEASENPRPEECSATPRPNRRPPPRSAESECRTAAPRPRRRSPPRSARPSSDPLRPVVVVFVFAVVVVIVSLPVVVVFAVVVVVVLLFDLIRNLVVPIHSCPMSACAVALVVQESTCLKHCPVPTNLPSVIRVGVRHLAGGAPPTRSGVKSSRLGLWCTRAASSLSRHHSSSSCTG